MKHDPDVLENIKEVFSKRGLNLNALRKGQAMVPDVCTVIQNKFGTAPVCGLSGMERLLCLCLGAV